MKLKRQRDTNAVIRLIGVIHLPPLPGSPRAGNDAMKRAIDQAVRDAKLLVDAGYDLAMLENFGDAPFFKESVPPVTVAALTACAMAVREAHPDLRLGVNVLRNDVHAALSIATVVGAEIVRVNVHTGARIADQGLIEGKAAETLRLRAAIGASKIGIWADVDVKHSAPITERPIEEEAKETFERGAADALLVTGSGTGARVGVHDLERVRKAVPKAPLYIASGADVDPHLREAMRFATGVIVGTAIKIDGRAGGPVDRRRAVRFAEGFRSL